MRLVLAATESALADAWRRQCGELPDVSVHCGPLLELEVDAVVCPANSFGFMEGGVAAACREFFGGHIQDRLQALLRARHDGELPVGEAEILATDHPRVPFLLAAPTMRVPMSLARSVNPYLATRAALRLVKHGQFAPGSGASGHVSQSVQTIAFPGLGAGTGGVDAETCASQMRAAIEQVLLGRVPRYARLAEASAAHAALAGGA